MCEVGDRERSEVSGASQRWALLCTTEAASKVFPAQPERLASDEKAVLAAAMPRRPGDPQPPLGAATEKPAAVCLLIPYLPCSVGPGEGGCRFR